MIFSSQEGFTLPELVVGVAIFSMLSVLAVVNLNGARQKADVRLTVSQVVSDIRQQQIKTMSGDTQGTGTITNYGIKFTANDYTLFHGASYNAADPANFTTTLDTRMQIQNNTFPNSTLLFAKGTGELSGTTSGSFELKNLSNGDTKTMTINRYGVITGVN